MNLYFDCEMSRTYVSIYMKIEYLSIFEKYDEAALRVLVCEKEGKVNYLPLLIIGIGENAKEAYSCYGYGGFVGDFSLNSEDVECLRDFLGQSDVVSLFVRHSPFLGNHVLISSDVIEFNRHTYSVALQLYKNFNHYLVNLPQKLRWSVNYARRAGLKVSFRPLSEVSKGDLDTFYEMYADLMRQKQTHRYYRFSENFIMQHALNLGKQCELVEVVDVSSCEIIAGALFLLDENGWVHYHLSASRQKAAKLQAMELLISTAIYNYGARGYFSLHLGGGLAVDESDGLSKFKSKFATHRLDFYCSQIICNDVLYHKERSRLHLDNPNFFLVSQARKY